MFVSKIAKPQTVAAKGSASGLVPHRSILAEHLARRTSTPAKGALANHHERKVTTERMTAQEASPRTAYGDVSKILVSPPERASRVQLLSTHSAQPVAVQLKLAIGPVDDPLERDAERIADRVMRAHASAQSNSVAAPPRGAKPLGSTTLDPATQMFGSPSQLLDSSTKNFFESRSGFDFSGVRVHTDERAAQSAQEIGAHAFTFGRSIGFGHGRFQPQSEQGKRLLAHELAHVMQQAAAPSSPVTLRRYAAGEHAQFGETGPVLRKDVSDRAFAYKVRSGDTMLGLAARFGLSVQQIEDANRAKLKVFHNKAGAFEGFLAGEEILIPPVINDATREALKTNELTFVVNGVTLEYGVGITMGDFFEDPADMLTFPAAKLQHLADLVRKEKAGTPVTPEEWDKATEGRYLKLAKKNEKHFSPSNPSLVDVSGAPHTGNNKSEWEKSHKTALDTSQSGSKDEALRINSFGDHFLTDALAAGHLVNKRDVMEKFKSKLTNPAAFFDEVAKACFIGAVKAEFSKYKTVEGFGPFGAFHPAIDSENIFSKLLQAVQKQEPDELANVAAKAVHDSLNTASGGVAVENNKGDAWQLSGDGTLNAKSLEIGRKAVAQSQLNVLDVFKMAGPLDYPKYFKNVWDFVPRPTKVGETQITEAVASSTDPKGATLIKSVADLVSANYSLIIGELVKRGKLQPK